MNRKSQPISVFMISLNEEDRIEKSIRSAFKVSDDVIVVDSGSTDRTIEIARSWGARVVHNDWPGYGMQKRFAQDLCRHDWVLNLDADEVISDPLAEEINGLHLGDDSTCKAFFIKITDVLPGEDSPRLFSYSHNYIRLYRKDAGEFSTSTVHDLVQLREGVPASQLHGRIFHHSIRSLGEQLSKFNTYTDAQILDMEQRGKKIPAWRLFIEFPASFVKAYLLRRHFMRGTYGFLTAMNYAYFRHLRVAKHYERRRTPKPEK
ncbi:MAG: glycosyltransferase family 2 protein [Gammaproteobacteria bacterium]|nr:glycosyltransferase family 2 protein [Gammaproteobacteria bacterium]